MLHHSLYSHEDLDTQRCSTAYCKCLNVRIDFIDQSLQRDRMEPEYQSLESALDAQSGINCTLFFRAFVLSIHVKFRWLISSRWIHSEECPDEAPQCLYQCHCCSYHLFVSTDHILGKSLINHQLQNFDRGVLCRHRDYSSLFHIVVEPSGSRTLSLSLSLHRMKTQNRNEQRATTITRRLWTRRSAV